MVWAITFADLIQPLKDRHWFPLWCGGHVTVGQRLVQLRRLGSKLTRQLGCKLAFSGFYERTGMVSYQAT
ncbi:hypothetical protein SAMN04489713_102154 [Actinomadura madurae]|uniref:Uncharacterized protein n=1 Tax=Actinomadura madurae TaxID=1993 RepID=A0A1I4ZCT7_9ACTN|nr:hypothetical protein SAMN04489713_102154 [Actinomadura madurae]